MSEEVKFIRGNDHINQLAQRPYIADGVTRVRADMAEADSIYAIELAALRQAAELTKAWFWSRAPAPPELRRQVRRAGGDLNCAGAIRQTAFSVRCSYTGCMSAMREELHHLVDELPEAEVRPVLELIRSRADAAHGVRDLPFFASFESDPDLAEKSEEILRAEFGR